MQSGCVIMQVWDYGAATMKSNLHGHTGAIIRPRASIYVLIILNNSNISCQRHWKRQTTRPFSGLLLLHQVDALMNRELRTVEIPITGKYGMGRSHFLIIRSISSDSARSLGSSLFHQRRRYIPIQNRRIGISSHRLWRAIRRMMLPMAKCCTIWQRTSAILRTLKACYT